MVINEPGYNVVSQNIKKYNFTSTMKFFHYVKRKKKQKHKRTIHYFCIP